MYVSLGILVAAAVIIILWIVTVGFMRYFRRKWRGSVKEVLRRNGNERVMRQALNAYLSETTAEMLGSVEILTDAVRELDSASLPEAERKSILNRSRSALSAVKKNLDNLACFHLLGNNTAGPAVKRNYPAARCVETLVTEMKDNPETSGTDIRVKGMDDKVRVPLNPDILDIMLFNIARNLLRNCPEGRRRAEIRMGHTDRHGVSCNVAIREGDYCGKYLMYSISVKGSRLPDTDREILKGNYDMESAIRDGATNTGLYYTLRLAELHKGYIWLSDTGSPDSTRISVALPYEECNYAAADFAEEENYSGNMEGDEAEGAQELTEEDRRLMDELREIIRQDVSNPDLDISLICKRMHISRSKLYYKINRISGVSPKEFLRQYRLELSSYLLSEGKMNVSEVADAVGFNSVSYFSKAFKKKYGCLPSEKLQ